MTPPAAAVPGEGDSASARMPGLSVVWTGIVAAGTVVGISAVAILRFLHAFGSAGLAVEVALPANLPSPAAPSGGAVQVTQGIVTVPHAGSTLIALVIGTILVAAIAGILIVACAFILTLEIARGRMFSRRAIRMLGGMALTAFVGTAGCYALDTEIGRSVRAAAGLGAAVGSAPLSYWMGFAIGGMLTVITIAFHRGAALQKDTEGLV